MYIRKIVFGLLGAFLFTIEPVFPDAGKVPFTLSTSINFFQYMNQQINLESSGVKLNPALVVTFEDSDFLKTNPLTLALMINGAPTPNSQQSAAQRLALPADLDLRIQQLLSDPLVNKDFWFFVRGDLLSTTLKKSVIPGMNSSQTLYTPGFLSATLGAFQVIPIENSIFTTLILGGDIRVSRAVWNDDSLKTLFPGPEDPSTNWDSTFWIQTSLSSSTQVRFQFYNYVSGQIGEYAYNGGTGIQNNNFFNTGAFNLVVSQNFDLGVVTGNPTPQPTQTPTPLPAPKHGPKRTPSPTPIPKVAPTMTPTPLSSPKPTPTQFVPMYFI